jgi:hypothetical protein
LSTFHQGRDDGSIRYMIACEKRLLFSAFPMFVLSLSW